MLSHTTKAATICLLLGIAVNTIAQEKIIKQGNQQWLQYYAQIKLSDKWTLLPDAGFRFANHFQAKSQYLIRVGLNYTINPNIQVGGGFAHFGTYTSGKISRVDFVHMKS